MIIIIHFIKGHNKNSRALLINNYNKFGESFYLPFKFYSLANRTKYIFFLQRHIFPTFWPASKVFLLPAFRGSRGEDVNSSDDAGIIVTKISQEFQLKTCF